MRQREAFEHGGAMGVFGALGFEKLTPRRGVEKQIVHFHRGARRVGGGADVAGFAVLRANGVGMAVGG